MKMRMDLEKLEFNEKTLKFDRTFSYKDYNEDQIRDCDWCTICGFGPYPECRQTCDDYEAQKDKKILYPVDE